MKNNYKRKRIIFIRSILAISISALIFVIFNFQNNIVFFYSPSEINSSLLNQKSISGVLQNGLCKNFLKDYFFRDASKANTIDEQEHELTTKFITKDKICGSAIRVGGLVKKGSIKKINNFATEFVITDYKNNLEIFYSGILPDLFRDNQGVVAKGYLIDNDKFYAKELLIKHDENYMPPEVAKILKDNKN